MSENAIENAAEEAAENAAETVSDAEETSSAAVADTEEAPAEPKEESSEEPAAEEKTGNESGDPAEKPKKKRHIVRNILLVVLALILILVIFVVINAKRNVKEMNRAADKTVDTIKSYYTLKEVDCSEFEDLTVKTIMHFKTEQYEIEGLGNLCVMRANGGIMQMLTAIITPVNKDMPLMSIDYMYILGNRTAYVEVYDLAVDKNDVYNAAIEKLKAVADGYTSLKDTTPSSAWYDNIRPAGSYKKEKPKNDDELLKMLESYLKVYLEESKKMEALPEEKIPEKIDVMEGYSHRLISEGGISTDTFKETLGEERTKELFDTVMFGTQNYRK